MLFFYCLDKRRGFRQFSYRPPLFTRLCFACPFWKYSISVESQQRPAGATGGAGKAAGRWLADASRARERSQRPSVTPAGSGGIFRRAAAPLAVLSSLPSVRKAAPSALPCQRYRRAPENRCYLCALILSKAFDLTGTSGDFCLQEKPHAKPDGFHGACKLSIR